MKISYSWLSDYVDLDEAPAELAERLTLLGLEVDSVDVTDLSHPGVVVGHVLDVKPHPDADRLVLCEVDVGGDQPSQIVCGAPNVAAGQTVPVALPGAVMHLPDRDDPSTRKAITLKRAKIRGEFSEGMICAEDELGLSEDHSGIMVLDGRWSPGTPFADVLRDRGVPSLEAVFDIELTPNRPDATSHVGVAREVSAYTGNPLRIPSPEQGKSEAARQSDKVSITIENPDGCGRYVGILVEGVTVGPSPDWMTHRLEAIGLRPRNNIVDITNYVMFELGQPLHAFDFEEIAGGSIIVRNATDGEPFMTLDDVERRLDDQTLMICDADRSVAIAGVMGGQNSEVSASTTTVLIESAWFDPASIRRTAKTLGMQTDASYRFERGVDPDGSLRAARRAAELMVELAGGTIVETVDAHPRPHGASTVTLRPSRVEKILGVAIPPADIARYLERLGFTVSESGDLLSCVVPSFRPDIEREIDLIEEVARLYGFDKIPSPRSASTPYTTHEASPTERLRAEALTFLAGLGFRECYTNSLLPPAIAEIVQALLDPDGEHLVTHNAINHHMSALRPSLLPGVLRVAAHNRNHGQNVIRLAEFGHVFHKGSAKGETRPSWIDGYVERESLILAIAGPAVSGSWDREESLSDLFDLKGIVRSLTDYLDIDGVRIERSQHSHGATWNSLDITLNGERIGVAGQVNPLASRAFDLEADLFFAEIFWAPLAESARLGIPKPFEPISRFPTVTRDLSVIIPSSVIVGDLVDTIRVSGGPLLKDVGVFDVYEGEGIEAGSRSIGFTLEFGADRTLVDDEVDGAVSSIVELLSTDWKAKLRS